MPDQLKLTIVTEETNLYEGPFPNDGSADARAQKIASEGVWTHNGIYPAFDRTFVPAHKIRRIHVSEWV